MFALPALLLLTVSVAAWLALGSSETGFGPMRLMPLPPSASTPDAAAVEPPSPTQIERLSPLQAKIRNALLPFARSPKGLASAYVATTEPRAAALECLTRAIYYEAAREPELGKRAVAQVIVNRASSSPFPSTICGVVEQGAARPGCQFTFMCDGSLARRPDPMLWSEAQATATAALRGETEPLVGGATHYHADYVYPTWAPTMMKLVKIGAHIFYRWRAAVPRPLAPAVPDIALTTSSLPVEASQAETTQSVLSPNEPPLGARADGSSASVASNTGIPKDPAAAPPGDEAKESPKTAPPRSRAQDPPELHDHPRRAIPERPLGASPL